MTAVQPQSTRGGETRIKYTVLAGSCCTYYLNLEDIVAQGDTFQGAGTATDVIMS